MWTFDRTSDTFVDDVMEKYNILDDHGLRRRLVVNFVGEPGIDMGAISREFFLVTLEAIIGGQFKGERISDVDSM